jgi:predicted nucleic acid-binding protein
VTLYVESSAVLAWLLGEPAGNDVQAHLAAADAVASSELTLVECERVLHRAVDLGEMREADAAELRGVLAAAARGWHMVQVDQPVLDRARRPFPAEPVRTLDALHLASAVLLAPALPSLTVLSLDERVRRNAAVMGLPILP